MANQAEINQKPLSFLDMARQALAELKLGNISTAMDLRNEMISYGSYAPSGQALKLMSEFTRVSHNDSALLMELAVKAAKSGKVQLAESLAERSLALRPSANASAAYAELRQILPPNDVVESEREAV